MAVRHMRDGEDFFDGSGEKFAEMKDFGFGASVNKPTMESGRSNKSNVSRPGGAEPENFAKGGAMHGSSEHGDVPGYAEGGVAHPLGNDVVQVEQKEDGSTIHHHSHGGFTIHHPMGGISHHMADGTPAIGGITSDGTPPMAHGGHVKHPHGDSVHGEMRRADGGRVQCHAHGGMTIHHPDGHVSHHDANGMPLTHGEGAAMIKSGFRQHENAEHGGEHEEMKLAGGGMVGHRAHLPRDMKPKAARPSSPINTPPRNPTRSITPKNIMAGGVEPYGVQPSSEPDMAGSDQGIPQLRKGGRMKGRE